MLRGQDTKKIAYNTSEKITIMNIKHISRAAFVLVSLGLLNQGYGGAIFITGHDPDFHAQGEPGAANLLRIGLNYSRNGGSVVSNPGALPVLWIESDPADFGGVPGGHRFGLDGLRTIGYLAVGEPGVASEGRYVFADAADLTSAFWATVTPANFSAIGVASTFGGTLRQAELDNLNGHSADIATFFNAGGGIFAAAEGHEGADLAPAGGYFDWIPVTAASTTSAAPPYSVTPFGASLGLTDNDVSSPSHSHFTSASGLNIVSLDSNGDIMTLASVTTIGGGGFSVPDFSSSFLLFGTGLVALWTARRALRTPSN